METAEMAAERDSKAAIRELAGLLDTDRPGARAFLLEVQARCGRIPFRTITDEVHACGIADVDVVARRINAKPVSVEPGGRG